MAPSGNGHSGDGRQRGSGSRSGEGFINLLHVTGLDMRQLMRHHAQKQQRIITALNQAGIDIDRALALHEGIQPVVQNDADVNRPRSKAGNADQGRDQLVNPGFYFGVADHVCLRRQNGTETDKKPKTSQDQSPHDDAGLICRLCGVRIESRSVQDIIPLVITPVADASTS